MKVMLSAKSSALMKGRTMVRRKGNIDSLLVVNFCNGRYSRPNSRQQ